MNELYTAVDLAIDQVFEHDRFVLNVYDFAKSLKLKRDDMVKFINSSVAKQVRDTVEELDAYLVGGNKQLREAYGHIPKPRARKIRNYLHGFLEDALRYERDRKPGRRRKSGT